jgi:hypothetical protein
MTMNCSSLYGLITIDPNEASTLVRLIMKSFVRNAFLGAAGLLVVSLPAHALSSTAGEDAPSNSTTTLIKLAQRSENPGGAGFRNENPGGAGFRNENPGGPSFKKKAKKPKKKKMTK